MDAILQRPHQNNQIFPIISVRIEESLNRMANNSATQRKHHNLTQAHNAFNMARTNPARQNAIVDYIKAAAQPRESGPMGLFTAKYGDTKTIEQLLNAISEKGAINESDRVSRKAIRNFICQALKDSNFQLPQGAENSKLGKMIKAFEEEQQTDHELDNRGPIP